MPALANCVGDCNLVWRLVGVTELCSRRAGSFLALIGFLAALTGGFPSETWYYWWILSYRSIWFFCPLLSLLIYCGGWVSSGSAPMYCFSIPFISILELSIDERPFRSLSISARAGPVVLIVFYIVIWSLSKPRMALALGRGNERLTLRCPLLRILDAEGYSWMLVCSTLPPWLIELKREVVVLWPPKAALCLVAKAKFWLVWTKWPEVWGGRWRTSDFVLLEDC